MKKYIAYGILVIGIILVVNIVVKSNAEGNTKIVTAFENGNYLNSIATVESFFYYGDVYLKEEERKEILENIVRELGIKKKYRYEEIEQGDSRISKIDYAFKDGSLTLELSTQENKISKNVYNLNHFLTVQMKFENSPETAWYYKGELEEILAALPYMYVEPEVSICMKGELSGEISPVSKKKMCKEIFTQLGAKIVLDYWNQNNTMYGYSEDMEGYKTIGGKKVNVNVAFGYDEIKDMTTVYVASPIYNGDY